MTTVESAGFGPDGAGARRRLAVDLLIAAVILVAFGLLYHRIALAYGTMAGFHDHNNVIFGTDHHDALRGWVKNHKGTHPILMLIVVPLGRVFEAITGGWERGLLLQTAVIAGATVAAFFGLCRMLARRLLAVAVACFFGLSMAQLTIGCVPDSFELACLSTIPGYALLILGVRRGRASFWPWIAAGVLTFGVTVPNFAQTLFCFVLLQRSRRSLRRALVSALLLVAAVVAVTAALSLVQHLVVPGSKSFFVPGEYTRETRYVSNDILTAPGLVIEELIRNVLVHPAVGPDPVVSLDRPGRQVELVYRDAPFALGWIGVAPVLLWLTLLVRGAISGLRDRATRPVALAAALAVGANVVLHSFFGTTEMFLFALHFLAPLVLLAIGSRDRHGPWLVAAWCALAVLTGISNLTTVRLFVSQHPDGDATEVIPYGADWRYLPGTRDPGADWASPGFDDSGWDLGESGFGYGDGDDDTKLADMRNRYTTVFTRRAFEVPDLDTVVAVLVDVEYDDGFALFLNGRRVLSRHAPKVVTHESLATGDHESESPLRCRLPREDLVAGRNTIAAVGLNRDRSSSDFTLRIRVLRIDRDDD